MSKINLIELERTININFINKENLILSLTHKSHNSKINNERLEFIGDRVLGLIISSELLKIYPNQKVGYLDKMFASMVNKRTLLNIGKKIGLEKFIIGGNTTKKNIEDKIISDTCEALIGAIFLDFGYIKAKKFILNYWEKYFKLNTTYQVDSKTKLQEYSLKKYKVLPIYKLISNSGPRHKPIFKIGVRLKNTKFVYATGSSKKNAESKAAEILLKNIGVE
jgi:ribonuclease-3|tara:strand:+ start:34 stop:699 length:666 start_codon:yes stop_codon:yes gene_type:complete